MKGSCLSSALTLLILIQYCTATSNTQFIKTSCSITTYPDLCFKTLSNYATKIQTSPKSLATTALYVSLETTRSTSTTMKKLSKIRDLTPREVAAMNDCVEELSESVYELQRSYSEMCHNNGGKKFLLQMNDIQTWVSAALTNDDTCMDGFSWNSMNGNVKNAVRSHILNVAQMTSNALALINHYASIHSS